MSNFFFCFRISKDSSFASLVAGVLVESGIPVENNLRGTKHSCYFPGKTEPTMVCYFVDVSFILQDFLQIVSFRRLSLHPTKVKTLSGIQLYVSSNN